MADLPARRERRDALPARWDRMREMEDVRQRTACSRTSSGAHPRARPGAAATRRDQERPIVTSADVRSIAAVISTISTHSRKEPT